MASLSPSPLPSQSPPSTTATPPSVSPPPPPSSPPPPPATVPPPSSPPPATVPPPSRPPVSSPPPTDSPPPSSPIPPTTSPPQPTSPPPEVPPPPPPSSPSLSPPPIPPPPPSNPTTSPPPLPSSSPPPIPPPPPSPSLSPPPIPPPPPSNSTTSPPPSPSLSPPPIPPPSPSLSPPPIPPPPSSPSPPLSPPPIPPPPSSVPPRNPPTIPPPPRTPRTPPPLRPPTNSSSPPLITAPPPAPSTPSPVIVTQPPPSPSRVLTPPPTNPSNNDTSPTSPSSNGGIGTGAKRKKKIAGHNGNNGQNGHYDLPTSMGNLSESGLLKIQALEIGNLSGNNFVYSPQSPNGLGNARSKFSYEDLVKATNGFSPENLLGSGGFGYVYKGLLADGTEVAVKELKIGSRQGEREFGAEVEIISRIHHRYLVSLVGYCVSEQKRLLVYEYVPNNTLYYHLHVSEVVLDWPTRVRVASGAARGIAYLHEDCHPRVIHRDIKSSNILLDKNFEARVSDFGLAKLAADLHTHVTTRVMGTFGYMAPEYASSGKLTDKSDVFSFGVVLLELITGRKPVDASQPLGDESLVEWARPLLSHALETEDFKVLVDPRLDMKYVPNEMFRMIEAAAACVRHSATKRPRMGQIVRAFESLETEDLSNGMKVGESEIFNSAQQSAEIRLFQRMAFGSQNYSTDYFTQGSFGTGGSTHDSSSRT